MDKHSIIHELREALAGREEIDYAYLFGSALKQLLPESDIDILVGGEFDFDRKNALTMELALRLKRNVDLVLAREASYELTLKVLSRGLPILVHNRESLRRDYFKSYFLYEANFSLRKCRRERLKRIYRA